MPTHARHGAQLGATIALVVGLVWHGWPALAILAGLLGGCWLALAGHGPAWRGTLLAAAMWAMLSTAAALGVAAGWCLAAAAGTLAGWHLGQGAHHHDRGLSVRQARIISSIALVALGSGAIAAALRSTLNLWWLIPALLAGSSALVWALRLVDHPDATEG
ncbi:MAG: hypothetical protein KGS47_11115 [Chloroflexi bacterium]|nr:hypothetical protein [Chloroflexota bacterium]